MSKKEKQTKTKEVPRPTKDQIISFIEDSPAPVGKREIARAFRLSAGDRVWLKGVLKDLTAEGRVERGRKRRVAKPGTLPEVAVIQVHRIDADGEVERLIEDQFVEMLRLGREALVGIPGGYVARPSDGYGIGLLCGGGP